MSLDPAFEVTDRAALSAALAGALLLRGGDGAALAMLLGGMDRADLECLTIRLVASFERTVEADDDVLRAHLLELARAGGGTVTGHG